jgi:hypothetical protein
MAVVIDIPECSSVGSASGFDAIAMGPRLVMAGLSVGNLPAPLLTLWCAFEASRSKGSLRSYPTKPRRLGYDTPLQCNMKSCCNAIQ